MQEVRTCTARAAHSTRFCFVEVAERMELVWRGLLTADAYLLRMPNLRPFRKNGYEERELSDDNTHPTGTRPFSYPISTGL